MKEKIDGKIDGNMDEMSWLLGIDSGKCIGCKACASSCPDGFIHLSESRGRRTIAFPKSCGLACEVCVSACPEGAIRHVRAQAMDKKQAEGPLSGSIELSFELAACGKCGKPFATRKELKRVLEAVEAEISAPESAWKEFCPSCRRNLLREKEAGAVFLARRF